MKILFTGGGTAGHIFPIIAISREIRKIYAGPDLQFFYLGARDEFSEDLLLKEGIKIKTIFSGKIRRYFGIKSFFQNLFDIFFKIPLGFLQAFFYIFFFSPDLIFSKGGYGSFPVVFSGWLLFVPVFIHESDVEPGLANKLAARFALEVFVSFPAEEMKYLPPKKMLSVGNPVRGELLEGDKEKAKTVFNLSGEKPLLLVLGGSQGSLKINDILFMALPELLKSFEVIHQVGQKKFTEVKEQTEVMIPKELQRYYHPISFLSEEELKHAYFAADLIVSRAGSGSIFEIAAVGKPSILIPLPASAQDHQLKNAYVYAKKGACLVIEESNLTPHFFGERIRHLISQSEEFKDMAEKARAFSKPQAGKIIAQYLIVYLTR